MINCEVAQTYKAFRIEYEEHDIISSSPGVIIKGNNELES